MNPQIRLLTSEQLDNLSLSGKPLEKTLSSLKMINSFFGNHKQLSKSVLAYCKANSSKKELRIVDLGCGGGDCIQHITKKTRKHKINVSFTGIDGNPESISYAIKNNPYPSHTKFIVADILDSDFVVPNCDLLISSHFVYHFKNENLTNFIKKIQFKDIKHLIFSELYRNKTAYYLFKMISFVFPISDIAKKDGLIAIQRAFTINELKEIIQNSGVKKFKIVKKPFFRSITNIDL